MSLGQFFVTRKAALMSLVVLVVFAVAIAQMQFTTTPPFPQRAKLFPLIVAVPMVVIALYQVVMDLWARPAKKDEEGPERAIPSSVEVEEYAPEFDDNIKPTAQQTREALFWFFAFFVMVWSLGFMIAIPLFTFVYFVIASRDKWYWGLVAASISFAFLYGMFDQALHIPMLQGQLFVWLGLV
jgi:hypothetical protein